MIILSLVLLSTISIIGIIAASLIVLFIIAAIFGNYGSKKEAKIAAEMIKQLEEKYLDFIEKRISICVLKDNTLDIDVDLIANEAFTVLKPNFDGLIATINSATYSSVKIEYESTIFANAAGKTSEMFKRRKEQELEKLTPADENEFVQTFKNAILSDLTSRSITLKNGVI